MTFFVCVVDDGRGVWGHRFKVWTRGHELKKGGNPCFREMGLWFLMKWKKHLGQLMVKIFGNIQQKLCIEGFKGETEGVVVHDKNNLG